MAKQKEWRKLGNQIGEGSAIDGLGALGGGLLDFGETAITGMLGQINPMFQARLKAEDELRAANALSQRKSAAFSQMTGAPEVRAPLITQEIGGLPSSPAQNNNHLPKWMQEPQVLRDTQDQVLVPERKGYGDMNSAQMEQALMKTGVPGLDKTAQLMALQRMDAENNRRSVAPASGYSDVKIDPVSGRAFGQNKATSRYEKIAGDRMNVKPDRPDSSQNLALWNLQDRMTGNYDKSVGRSMSVIDQYDSMVGSAHNSVGDKNLLLSFYKIKDPTSVVSGNEEASAANAPGWTAEMRTIFNKVFRGGELPQSTRDEYMSFGLTESNRNRANIRRQQEKFSKSAISRQLDPAFMFSTRTFKDLEPVTAEQKAVKEAAKDTSVPTIENVIKNTAQGPRWTMEELDSMSLEELRALKAEEMKRRAREQVR